MKFSEIEILDAKGLRKFGFQTGSIFAVLFGLVFPLLFGFDLPIWPWGLAAILVVWALLHSPSLNPVYIVWMRLGVVMGWVMNKLVLTSVFVVIFIPIGLIMRIIRRDPLDRSFDEDAKSYKKLRGGSLAESMDNPF